MSEMRKAVRRAIAAADLGSVYVVEIEGEKHKVSGDRAYCERRKLEAEKKGKKASLVYKLTASKS